MQIVQAEEGTRQVFFDELQRAARGLDADLDEDAGWLLDVIARGLNEPWRLPQLRQHAAGALRRRRVAEERLAGHAGSQNIGVVLGVLLPRPSLFELEHPPANIRREHAMLETFGPSQLLQPDFPQPPEVPRQRAGFAFNAVLAEVLQQVVVGVDSVERRVRRMRLVQVPEQVVDEVRQRFGNDHGSRWYNTRFHAVLPGCPVRCSSSPRRSATSTTSPRGPYGCCVR